METVLNEDGEGAVRRVAQREGFRGKIKKRMTDGSGERDREMRGKQW